MKAKYTKAYLNRLRKAELFNLCLQHFGRDTAVTYHYYTKAELIDDLLTVMVD